MKLELSNVVLRAYKKKNKNISLNIRNHLLVSTNEPFSFTGYMKKMQGWVTLPGQNGIKAKSMSISVACSLSENVMIHNLYVKFELPNQKLETSIANLRLMFHISFTGHPYEVPIYIKKKGNYSGRFLNQEDSTGRKGFPLMAAVIESRMFRPCFLAVER